MILIEMHQEQIDKIILEALQDDYIMNRNEIRELKRRPQPLEPYKAEDLRECKKIKKALKRVIKYNMCAKDFGEWIANV